MKEDTPNCSWQDSTHFNFKEILDQRLYIFTGKGGSGKTSLALAWAQCLINQNKKVLFNNLGQSENQKTITKLKIPYIHFDRRECTRDYMASQLKSKIIANWIMDTSFFSALYKIVPSLGYITYLGKIVKTLREDHSMKIVIDAESTGHVLTMLEGPTNLKNIFLSGLLTEDIQQITHFLHNPRNTAIFTLCNPSSMSMSENEELRDQLSNLGFKKILTLINNSFSRMNLINPPEFLHKKILIENQAIHGFGLKINHSAILPHIAKLDEADIVSELVKCIQELIH